MSYKDGRDKDERIVPLCSLGRLEGTNIYLYYCCGRGTPITSLSKIVLRLFRKISIIAKVNQGKEIVKTVTQKCNSYLLSPFRNTSLTRPKSQRQYTSDILGPRLINGGTRNKGVGIRESPDNFVKRPILETKMCYFPRKLFFLGVTDKRKDLIPSTPRLKLIRLRFF